MSVVDTQGSKSLTNDELADFYHSKTGEQAKVNPVNVIYEWAAKQPEITVNPDSTLSFKEKNNMTEFKEVEAGQSKEMPARIVVYGRNKIGKTTLACSAPDAFLIDLENGAKFLNKKVRSTPHINSYDDLIGWLKHIYESDFTCGTIVIDSLDSVEELAQSRLIRAHGAKSITDPKVPDFSYYKGVMQAATDSIKILQWLDAIQSKKGIKCILIAHSQVKDIDLPGKAPFSSFQLRLSKWFTAKVSDWTDCLLFATLDFAVSKDGITSKPKRVLCTGGDMSYEGGGRVRLPETIKLSYSALEAAFTGEKS